VRPLNGRPSSPPSARGFQLSGPSSDPDPARHAYRKDLADIALAGTVIASHYASPVPRRIAKAATLFAENNETTAIGELVAGDPFELLDDSLGWAWGYAGAERRVGYVRSECLKA
jgi:hypothetical protein